MLVFKIAATFLLLWLAAELVALIYDSKAPRGLLTSLTASLSAVVACYLWLA